MSHNACRACLFAGIRRVGFELRLVWFSDHNVQLNRLPAGCAFKQDLGADARGHETTSLVVLEVVVMAAFQVALQTFGIGLCSW